MTGPDPLERTAALFDQLVSWSPDQQRAALAAEPDGAVRDEVERLLALAGRVPDGFLTPPANLTAAAPADPWVGQTVGPYQLVRLLAEGGMGRVYDGVRDDGQFRQRVAVKLVGRDGDRAEIVRRFRMERQILAALRHPHIAGLLDGGETADGVPYFVMEYIAGDRIEQWCDARRWPLRPRVELFRQVCAAVEFAHDRGVFHCDLKPANILVTADGVAKLLDFGIAKLVAPELAAATPTRTEFRFVTVAYASPEQLRGEPLSRASDVYSLGVILYELLTRHSPYDLWHAPPALQAGLVIEGEPPLPSRIVGRPLSGGATAATACGPPAKVAAALRGDLDAILLKALEKLPARRYRSPADLSADLGRWLAGEPALARRPSRAERVVRWARRKPAQATAATAAAAAAALAVALVVVLALAAQRAKADRAETERALGDTRAALAQAERAKQEADEMAAHAHRQTLFALDFLEGAVTQLARERPADDGVADIATAAHAFRKSLAAAPLGARDPRSLEQTHRVGVYFLGSVLMAAKGDGETAADHARRGLDLVVPLVESLARHPGTEDLRRHVLALAEGVACSASASLDANPPGLTARSERLARVDRDFEELGRVWALAPPPNVDDHLPPPGIRRRSIERNAALGLQLATGNPAPPASALALRFLTRAAALVESWPAGERTDALARHHADSLLAAAKLRAAVGELAAAREALRRAEAIALERLQNRSGEEGLKAYLLICSRGVEIDHNNHLTGCLSWHEATIAAIRSAPATVRSEFAATLGESEKVIPPLKARVSECDHTLSVVRSWTTRDLRGIPTSLTDLTRGPRTAPEQAFAARCYSLLAAAAADDMRQSHLRESLRLLREASRLGYRDYEAVAASPEFAALRSSLPFQAWFAEVRPRPSDR